MRDEGVSQRAKVEAKVKMIVIVNVNVASRCQATCPCCCNDLLFGAGLNHENFRRAPANARRMLLFVFVGAGQVVTFDLYWTRPHPVIVVIAKQRHSQVGQKRVNSLRLNRNSLLNLIFTGYAFEWKGRSSHATNITAKEEEGVWVVA
jgi:hypothetical protein